jgi:hypothetical protein
MSDHLLIATRKGLFALERQRSGWSAKLIGFDGIAVTNVLPVDGVIYAALKHGHFGAKLHRSDDGGLNWRELAAPAFPADVADAPSLFQVWTMEAGGAQHPNRLWIGAIPAGLFRSDDRGETWQLVASLWNVPERQRWFGGGYDAAGIHSISPDPRDSNHVFLAISCGGVWESRDSGKHWFVLGKGLYAPYVPPEQAEDSAIQDPHRVVRCAAAPDVMWMQPPCRHLSFNRCRRALDAPRAARRRFRLCSSGPSAGAANCMVRSGDQGRDSHAARWRVVRHANR